jgi:hypothetical protein
MDRGTASACERHFVLWRGPFYMRWDNQLPKRTCMDLPTIFTNLLHTYSNGAFRWPFPAVWSTNKVTGFFWSVTQGRMVILYRRFGTRYRSNQRSRSSRRKMIICSWGTPNSSPLIAVPIGRNMILLVEDVPFRMYTAHTHTRARTHARKHMHILSSVKPIFSHHHHHHHHHHVFLIRGLERIYA